MEEEELEGEGEGEERLEEDEEVGRTGEGATLTGAMTLEVRAAEEEYTLEVELPDGLGTQRLLRERASFGVTGAATGTAASTPT